MEIRKAKESDIGQWLQLVKKVRASFPGLETEEALKEHEETVLQFIENEEAAAAFEEQKLVGAMLYSGEYNMICFLAVDPKHRKKGIATLLLRFALDALDGKRDVTVSTFRDGDEKGAAARALYRKLGFQAEELTVEFGYPCQVFRLHQAGKDPKMKKVIVIGCPGAGKSTFSRKLRDKTGLPLFYLDRLWHKPDKTTVSKDEFDARLAEILRKEEWIIDGNFNRTLERRLAVCDTVFLLDFPLAVCLDGVSRRIGKKREDMPWVETEFDEDFKSWITDFPNVQLPAIYRLLEKYRDSKNIIIFKSRQQADEWLSAYRL